MDSKVLARAKTVTRDLADKVASQQGVVIPEEHLDQIAGKAASKIPEGMADKLSSSVFDAAVLAAVTEAANEISGNGNDKQAAHGGANMTLDYVDKINLESDKVAATHGPLAGAQVRVGRVAEDLPGAVAALFEKMAGMQDFIVKLSSVVEAITEGAVAQVAANQGNADATVQAASGTDESTQAELKNLEKVTGAGTGTSVMTGDPTGEASKITNPGAAGAGGVAPNPEPTTGDLIASSKATNSKVESILAKVKADKLARRAGK